jgi:hypothetical protein
MTGALFGVPGRMMIDPLDVMPLEVVHQGDDAIAIQIEADWHPTPRKQTEKKKPRRLKREQYGA